ncbi:uncharacterized protein LOC128676699 [Plodia interpunctella]|uniref:uncharacterized protein LOC128676699 n=1 Tax=Plodia interpunctella TaxID=58824 RepID=UPI00236812D6|nr:uncharacterized protein LOC128676699 [Plodia interpunctella]
MSKSVDIDKVGECLRNIVDNNRCGICDNLGKTFWRCVHGHIACGDCSVKEEECSTCYTIFNSPVSNNIWVEDEIQSEKAKHALELLNTFQDTFKTDVYRRQRISDQLKAEKELFPDCIQAPVKYTNKRKTLNSITSINDKKNSVNSYYPGQATFTRRALKMEKSKYVQQWLESSTEKRKPFANININNQRLPNQNKPLHKSRTAKNKCQNKLKRPVKTSNDENNPTNLRLKESSHTFLQKTPKKDVNSKNQNTVKDHGKLGKISRIQDDSGIAMDEEFTCITIEDSQEIIDKDALALQAVHEAERNELLLDSMHDDNEECKYDFLKVPFEKKSLLYLSCPNCNVDVQNVDSVQHQHTNTLSIIVEYGSKVETNVNMPSVSVQTEISEISKASYTVTNEYEKLMSSPQITKGNNKVHLPSQDLFIDDINNFNTHVQNDILVKKGDTFPQNKENVRIIDDSDTDVEAEQLQVAAEVHRTCELKDYEVLSELALNEMENRKRRAERGVTPGSSDSSEKENLDPNRMKRFKCMKKSKNKHNKV